MEKNWEVWDHCYVMGWKLWTQLVRTESTISGPDSLTWLHSQVWSKCNQIHMLHVLFFRSDKTTVRLPHDVQQFMHYGYVQVSTYWLFEWPTGTTYCDLFIQPEYWACDGENDEAPALLWLNATCIRSFTHDTKRKKDLVNWVKFLGLVHASATW